MIGRLGDGMNKMMPLPDDTIKACCTAVYQSDWAKLLLGDSFHPGGLALTERLGNLLDLGPAHHVLDVASGPGTSALFLAERFGCRVTGVDYGAQAVAEANESAANAGLTERVHFEQGDAERLPFAAGLFDVVLCECALCTFPSKETAAAEFARVLKPGGQLGLSDLTRSGPLSPELDTLLGWIACIADARHLSGYTKILSEAGFTISLTESHQRALSDLVKEIRAKLLGAELLLKLKQIKLPGVDFAQAKGLVKSAATAVQAGQLGYAIIIAQTL